MLRKLLLVVLVGYSCSYNVELDWSYVLNNPDFVGQKREAYFGYTVALFTSSRYGTGVLVGAPRANDTELSGSDVVERGAVYLCQLPSTACRQLVVTDAANGSEGGAGNDRFETLQDQGWLGGSLDLRPQDSNPLIVTCSPRWMNQRYSHVDYFVNGACYQTTVESVTSSGAATNPWNLLLPLVDLALQSKPDENGTNRYYYQLGQAGLSLHISEGDKVWLGAPGIHEWTGSGVKVEANTEDDWRYARSEVFEPAIQGRMRDYFGYSVGSGQFFSSQTHQIAGSPRHDLVGKVSIFSTVSGRIQVRWEATGPQVGCYFGSAVAAGDVNADGWSELFVGAPLFSVKGTLAESGLVVIYARKANLDDLEEGGRLVGSGQGGARFGSALMVVGDLDRDGYRDLAVGAPYEAGGAGAVYIYRGSANGLVTSISQKLSAKDVSSNLRGFGISISRGADVDVNGYTDVAVGAHEGAGSAVVLRTRPVVKVTLDLSTDHEILTEMGMTFTVEASVSYTGFNVLDVIAMTFTGLVDEGVAQPRAIFEASGEPQLTRQFFVSRWTPYYITMTLKLKDNIEDYMRPLELSFSTEVDYDDPGCQKCGLVSPGSSLRSRLSLPLLAPGCGSDGVCSPLLDLSLAWRGSSQLALRSESTVTLSIVVGVAGEPSYVGVVKVVLPAGLAAHQPLPYSCSQTGRQVSCDLPTFMAVGEKEEFEISVQESGDLLEAGELPLKVSCSASGAQEVEEEIVVSVVEDVKLELKVHFEDDTIEYSPPPAPVVATKLTYQIINRGDTRVNEVRLDTLIPATYDGMTFAQITQLVTSSSSATECSLQDASPGPAVDSGISEPPHPVSARLVCGEQPLLTCETVVCKVRQVHLAPIIALDVAYNTTLLTGQLGSEATIAIYTSASAAYGTPTPTMYTESGAWTTLMPKGWLPPARSTPVWPYVVAVLVAVLILAAVVVGLVKIGFFKRKRPGQSEAAGDLEGQAEGAGEGSQAEEESEVSPLQVPGHEEAAASTTTAEVTADIDDDGPSF